MNQIRNNYSNKVFSLFALLSSCLFVVFNSPITASAEEVPTEPQTPAVTLPETNFYKQTVRQNFIIKHAIRYRADDTLPIGETRVLQEGVNGYRTKTLVRNYFNGRLLSENQIDEQQTPAVDEIILIGTMEVKEPTEPELIYASRVNEAGLITPDVYSDGRVIFEGHLGKDIVHANEWGKALQFAQMEATWLDPSLPKFLNQVHGYGSKGIMDGWNIAGADFFFYRKETDGSFTYIDLINDPVYLKLALDNDLL